MSVFSKKTAISLACAAVLSGFAATPSFAGVITPADKETVAAETPLEFVGWRRICHYHCHWVRPARHWCHHPHHYYGYYVVTPAYYVATPAYYVAYPAWGWGWGGGGLLGGLFGI
jgi:hypothetical protein